mgnify:CR=1 FL=1
MVNQRNRNLGAITCRYPYVFATVIRRIKSGDLRLLKHTTFPGVHIQFKQCVRGSHGGIAIAQTRCLRLWIIGKPGHIGRIIKGNANDFPGLAVNLPQTG